MNILIIANHFAVASGRFYKEAFRRLGHDVKSIGPAHGNKIWGIEVDSRHIWKPDTLGDWKPDLIALCDCNLKLDMPQFKRLIGKAPAIVIGVDNHVADYTQDWIDHYFLAHKHGPAYPVGNRPNVTWLPCAYDPTIHRYITETAHRTISGALSGMPYQERIEVVEAIHAKGYSPIATLGALGSDYTAIYNRAIISICKSSNGDVAQRIFESAAMGNVILSDRCADMPDLGLIENVHFVGYASAQEAAEKFDMIMKDADLITRISKAARLWVLGHTWDNRAVKVLQIMRML